MLPDHDNEVAEETPRLTLTYNQFGNIKAEQARHADNFIKAQARQTREIVTAVREGLQGGNQGAGAVAAVGTLQPCNRGQDKMKRYKK